MCARVVGMLTTGLVSSQRNDIGQITVVGLLRRGKSENSIACIS